MARRSESVEPEIIVKRGKPAAVIIPLDQYQDMLERLEDADDLKALERMRKKTLRFRKLDDILKEVRRSV